MSTDLSKHPEYKDYTKSSVTTSTEAKLQEYASAFLQKYPQPGMSLIKNAVPFNFKIEDKFKIIYYRVKIASNSFSWFQKSGVEKVIVDLKNNLMETVEVCVDKKFRIPKDFFSDRVICRQIGQMRLEVTKELFTREAPGYLKRKLIEKGRKMGDAKMEELISRLRVDFNLF